MKKQIIALTVVLFACATVTSAHVRISLRGGVKNLHRQGVVALVKGKGGSALGHYRGVKSAPVARPTHVQVPVRAATKNLHQQGVNRLVKGTNEATLSQYHGVNASVVERKVVRAKHSQWTPDIPQQVRTTVTKEEAMRQGTYEIRVPNEVGGFDVYERTADGTITLKKP